MAHWTEAAVTEQGVEMLNEMMAGRFLTLTSAYGGSGLVDGEELARQTGLLDSRQKLSLVNEETSPKGKTVTVQIFNRGVAEEYPLQQIGVFAKLDAHKNPDAEEKLLFIMQDRDEHFASIPPESDNPYLLELSCIIGISNTGRFLVDVDMAGIVTYARLKEEMDDTLAAHNADEDAHPAILGSLIRMLMMGEVSLPLVTQSGEEIITMDGAVITAVKKI